jgi:hypothetical protein
VAVCSKGQRKKQETRRNRPEMGRNGQETGKKTVRNGKKRGQKRIFRIFAKIIEDNRYIRDIQQIY